MLELVPFMICPSNVRFVPEEETYSFAKISLLWSKSLLEHGLESFLGHLDKVVPLFFSRVCHIEKMNRVNVFAQKKPPSWVDRYDFRSL